MTVSFCIGDLVRAHGHAGTWMIDSLSQGRALLESTHDGHRLAVSTTTLSLVRPAIDSHRTDPDERPGGLSDPDLFD